MKKLSKAKRRESARCLVFAFLIYGGDVKGRGARGCLLDALKILMPKAWKRIGDGESIRDVYDRYWPPEEDM